MPRKTKGKIEHHEQLIQNAKQNIEDNKNRLKDLETALPTEEQFYELIQLYLLDLLQAFELTRIDLICNELVSNLRAGNDSISVIKLNPPYNLLVDLSEISTGRENQILLELFTYIIKEPYDATKLLNRILAFEPIKSSLRESMQIIY